MIYVYIGKDKRSVCNKCVYMESKEQQILIDFKQLLPIEYARLESALLSDDPLEKGFALEDARLLLEHSESVTAVLIPQRFRLSTARALQTIRFTATEKGVIDKIKAEADELGIKVYLAGGLVRDRLLGKQSSDLDFVVNEKAEDLVKNLAKKYDLSTPVIYGRSEAMAITLDDLPLDFINAEKVIAPLRDEKRLEGKEEFSVSLDDVYRRDLTINSLLWDISKNKIIDYTKRGLNDIEEGRINTIIDPFIKYKIHAFDMLRALRFAATLGFKIDERVKDAMKDHAIRVQPRDKGGDVSNRRIRRELRKAAATKESWTRMKQLLAEVGLFEIVRDDIEDVEEDLRGGIKYDYE